MQRTGLNRHRRGYVTKERVQRHVPFLVPGPIGLARSQFLNFILTSSFSSSIFPSHNRCHQIIDLIMLDLKSTVRVDRLVRTGAKWLGLIQTTGLIWAVGLKMEG